MVNVFAALHAAFEASPLAQSTKGLFYGRVFDRTVKPPYATYTLVSGVTDNDMSAIVDQAVIQVSIWSAKRSPNEVLALAKALWTAFDNMTLTMTGYTLIRMDRVSYNLLLDPDTEGWQMQTDYQILLQEQ